VFGKLSRNLGGFVEQVHGQAFRNSMAQGFPDVVCRYNHDDDWLLGTTKAGTCVLSVDATGLHYDTEIPDTRAGNDVAVLTKRGDVSSSSFAFRVPEGGDFWERSSSVGGLPLRTLMDLELVDVAPVNTPAYPDATASVRNYLGAIDSLARQFDADPAEIRSLLENRQLPKLFKRSDRPTENTAPKEDAEMANPEEGRAKISTASKNDLPDSDFAYIEDGGTKDESGKTTPRSKRHFPIHDAAHVRNALSRIGQGAQFGQQALPKVKAAAKKFGISSDSDDSKRMSDGELLVWAISSQQRDLGVEFDADDEERAKKQLPPWLQDENDKKADSDKDDSDDESKRDSSTNEDQDKSENDDEDDVGASQPKAAAPADTDSAPGTTSGTDTLAAKTAKASNAQRAAEDDVEQDEDGDNEEDDLEGRAAPGQPESKDDEDADAKEKAEAEKELKEKQALAENKRRLLALQEKRYDPWFFDGEDSE
jgi:hypothetical protein